MGGVLALEEFRFQLSTPAHALAIAVLSFAGGVLLGLWAPRRMILARLAQFSADDGGGRTDVARPGPVRLPAPDAAFASLVSAVLLLALAGLVWFTAVGAGILEGYRALLARSVLAPPLVLKTLLLGPASLLLCGLGVAATTWLVSLHGWLRCVCGAHARVVPLWATILCGVVLGLALHRAIPATSAAVLPGVLLLASVALSLAPVHSAPGETASFSLDRGEASARLHHAAAVLAAMQAGLVFSLVYANAGTAVRPAAIVAALLAIGALGGLGLARGLTWLGVRGDSTATTLAASAAWTALASVPFAPGARASDVLLALLTLTSAACVVFVGRRIGRARRSLQHALVRVGGGAAAGFAAGTVLGAWESTAAGPPLSGYVAALAAGLVSLALMRRDKHSSAVSRAAVLAGVAVIPAAALFGFWRIDASAAAQAIERPSAVATLPVWLRDQSPYATLLSLAPATALPSAWDADFAPDFCETAIVVAPPDARPLAPPDAARLLSRLRSRLLPGGRIVIERRGLTEATLAAWSATAPPGHAQRTYALDLRDGSERFAGLVVGDDAETWARRLPLPEHWTIELKALSGSPAP